MYKRQDPISETKFHNFEDTPAKKKHKYFQQEIAGYNRYNNFPKIIHVGFSTWIWHKILASYEILDYCKYLFDKDGFYRKSPKSELALEIQNNHNCGTNSQQDIIDLNTPRFIL